MRLFQFFLVAVFALPLTTPLMAQEAVSKGERKPVKPSKQGLADTKLVHEEWGQTFYGEGYVYGPTNRRAGMAVTDYDLDGDNDFAFPDVTGSPVIMRNLGSSNAFYPGGSKSLNVQGLPAHFSYSLSMDFEDINGDALPDLLAVVQRENPFLKGVVWFENLGPRHNPTYQYRGEVYTSPQEGDWPGMWVDSADIDGDGLVEVFIAEDFVTSAAPYHRVFMVKNTGTHAAPVWGTPTHVSEISALLPDPILLKDLNKNLDRAAASRPITQDPTPGNHAKGVNLAYNLGDIDLVDWDDDGVLDFMFYDKSKGLMWIRNVGTPTAPQWDNKLGNNGVPRYDHRETDEIDYAEGTFGVRPNPEAAKPGVEWLRDVYISVNSRLKTYRFFTQESAYRDIQVNAVAFPAGQGNAAFWDYDQDGDLDLFRMGVSSTANTIMLYFPNIGTPYAPAWGDFFGLPDLQVNEGSFDNYYRNDLYVFADHNVDGTMGFFVQRQDGRVSHFEAHASSDTDTPPTFNLLNDNFGDLVHPDHTDIMPMGMAIADFDYFEDGWSEVIVVYAHGNGANIAIYDTYANIIFDLPDFFPHPSGSGTLDPIFIEGITSGDLTGNGVPDIIVSYSDDLDFYEVKHLVYQNELLDVDPNNQPAFRFVYAGEFTTTHETDRFHARMPTLVDIDADGDMDLFVAHRYDNSSHLQPYLRFYRNQDPGRYNLWRTRTVTNQSWFLYWNGELPTYEFIANASGASISNPGNYITGPYAPAVDVIQSTDLAKDVRIFLDVLPEVGPNESKAIIIVGDTAGNSLYNTFLELGGIAYYVLLSEGLAPESIRFLADTSFDADDDGQNDVFNQPTLGRIQNAITSWAQGTDRLLVYMVGHGRRGSFRISDTEFLEATDYAQWLGQLQTASNTHVTTLMDTCEAGSFISPVAGPNRIVMTSSNQGPIEGIALFDQQRFISFSLNFWEEIFNGATYGQAFDTAKIAIEAINPLQTAMIDDDGNGTPNQANDGLVADGMRPGADFDLKGPNVFIGEVATNQAISTNSALLWLADVVSAFPVEAAGALIVPPNFSRPSLDSDDEQPVTGLDWINFNWNESLDRWQANYSQFTQGGLFQVQYFVKAGGRWVASPRIGFVDRLGIPDAWEDNNAPTSAKWLPINSVQGHNFHTANDEDWARFISPAGEEATIAVISPGPRNQPVVELYKLADLEDKAITATPVRRVQAPHPGGEVVFKHAFATAEPHMLRVRNLDGSVFGEGTSYLLLLAVGTGGANIIPTTLLITVVDQEANTPLGEASVLFNGSPMGKTTSDGVAQVLVPSYGTYTVNAGKAGFQNTSQSILINNNFESATLFLQKEDPTPTEGEDPTPTEGEDPTPTEGEGEDETPDDPKNSGCGCGPNNGDSGGSTGDRVVVFAALLFLLAGMRRKTEPMKEAEV